MTILAVLPNLSLWAGLVGLGRWADRRAARSAAILRRLHA